MTTSNKSPAPVKGGAGTQQVDHSGEPVDTEHNQQSIPIQLVIVVTPVPERPGYFVARLGDSGTALCTSRTPFFESARRLIELGHDPNSKIEMWHVGATEFALRARLGAAAKLTVEEGGHGPTFRRHRESTQSTVDGPPVASNHETAVSLAPVVDVV